MATETAPTYSQWLNQNPADANMMAQGFQAQPMQQPVQQPVPVTTAPAPAPAPAAAPAVPYSSQLAQLDTSPTTPVPPQSQANKIANAVAPEAPRAPAKKAGSSGLMKAASMVMAFYSGGLTAGLNAVAGQSQANSNAKGALGAISKFSQKPDEPKPVGG